MTSVDDPALEIDLKAPADSKLQSSSPPPQPPPITVMPSNSIDLESSPSSQIQEEHEESGMEAFNFEPPEPMEISISGEDAKNIREASRAFNEALKLLLSEEEKESRKKARISKIESDVNISEANNEKAEEDVKTKNEELDLNEEHSKREHQDINEKELDKDLTTKSESEKDVTNEFKEGEQKDNIQSNEKLREDETYTEHEGATTEQDDHDLKLLQHRLFVQAAERSGNPLVESFLTLIQNKSGNDLKQIQICLLLFVNMDKSSKLISAFDIAASSIEAYTLKSDDAKIPRDQSERSKKRKHANIGNQDNTKETGADLDDNDPSSSKEKSETPFPNTEISDVGTALPNVMESTKAEIFLHYSDLVSLFKCFLTSISSCIQENSEDTNNLQSIDVMNNNNTLSNTPKPAASSKKSSAVSPEMEVSSSTPRAFILSKKIEKEIRHSAVYATEQLITFILDAQKENLERDSVNKKVKPSDNDEGKSKSILRNVPVSFEDFGDWYNSGGFDLIPWIELLDLAKWESIENVPSSEQKENPSIKNDVPKQNSKEWEICEENIDKAVDVFKMSPPKQKEVKTFSQETNKVKNEIQHLKESQDKKSIDRSPTRNRNQSPTSNKHSVQRPSSSQHSSRSIVSFDFTSSLPSYYNSSDQPFCIDITAENLKMLKDLVLRTGLSSKSPSEVCDILLRHQYNDQMDRRGFKNCVRELFPSAMDASQFQENDLVTFSKLFNIFFSCFDRDGNDMVNVRELAVGFSFLCAGNKSKKLAVSFDLLDVYQRGYLSGKSLCQYLRSYLTMLVGISYLTSGNTSHDKDLNQRKADMIIAIDSGAQRTQGHVLKSVNSRNNQMNYNTRADDQMITFEEFADWYTEGGYTVAPWLELLDLKKFLSLLESTSEAESYDPLATTAIGEPSATGHHMTHNPPSSSIGLSPYKSSSIPSSTQSTQHYLSKPEQGRDNPSYYDSNTFKPTANNYPNETLFTFALAHKDSLIVTRDDAHYVHALVDQMKLLSFEPEDVFASLKHASNSKSRARDNSNQVMIDMPTFIFAMKDLINREGKLRMDSQMDIDITDKLQSLHKSFDLRREGYVSLNELMGGLTLLCGGRKSAKLSFAFGLFNRMHSFDRNMNEAALDERDLFTFFRSFLIVLFSCCSQSLYLSAEKRERNICDTAHMVCTNVMKHQWNAGRSERVNFDDFGEWYNVGGFEIAPWLELLDLTKWVLLDSPNPTTSTRHGSSQYSEKDNKSPKYQDHNDRNAYARHDLNSSSSSRRNEYESNRENILNMESNMRRQIPPKRESRSHYRDNYDMGDGSYHNNHSSPSTFSEGYDRHYRRSKPGYSSNDLNYGNALKFNLITTNEKKGFIVSIAQQRVSQIKHIVVESGLCRMDTASVCNRILENSVRSSDKSSEGGRRIFRRDTLDHVIRNMIDYCSKERAMSSNLQRNMSDTFMLIFDSFQKDRRLAMDEVNANEFACGFSILCFGRKSDKLEYGFDLLDENKDGKLSRRGMFIYLRSFLTVVMGLSISSHGSTYNGGERLMTMDGDLDHNASITHAIETGAQWATDQVFGHWRSSVTFDEFADWYTEGGYKSIPWLELLDLRKWVLVQT